MGRVGAVALFIFLAGVGCRYDRPSERGAPSSEASEVLPVHTLRVPSDRLTGIVLTQPDASPVRLQRRAGLWRVDSPVEFAANVAAVEPMEAVLSEIAVVRRVAERPQPVHRLEHEGISVRAVRDDGADVSFVIGASKGDETFVQIGDAPTVFAVRGRCRPLFARSLEDLRDATITDFDVSHVERVSYENREGRLELVPNEGHLGHFRVSGASIRNFDADRARQSLAVLAHLRAAGFVDEPLDREATGLFEPETATATIWLSERSEPIRVWIGERTRDRRLYVRSSMSQQIYLVSAHLMSSLVPRVSYFERSDDEVRVVREVAARLEDRRSSPAVAARENEAHTKPGEAPHTHGTPPPGTVPDNLLRELRALAEAQRSVP